MKFLTAAEGFSAESFAADYSLKFDMPSTVKSTARLFAAIITIVVLSIEGACAWSGTGAHDRCGHCIPRFVSSGASEI